MVKDLCVLASAVVFLVLGNLLLSQGMHQIGEVDILKPSNWGLFIHQIMDNRLVILGLGCLGVYFTGFLIALSRLDFSYVQPMLAANYVLTAVLACLVLRESMSGLRWMGIVCIAVGIVVVGLDERKRRLSRSL